LISQADGSEPALDVVSKLIVADWNAFTGTGSDSRDRSVRQTLVNDGPVSFGTLVARLPQGYKAGVRLDQS
jgi:hypothetical protein